MVIGRRNSRVCEYPIYYCLVSCEGCRLKDDTLAYKGGKLSLANYVGFCTYAMLVHTCIELLLNTLHYVDY